MIYLYIFTFLLFMAFYLQTGFWYCYAKIIYDLNQKGGIHANTKLYEVANEELRYQLSIDVLYHFYICFWPFVILFNITKCFFSLFKNVLIFFTKKFIRFYVWLIT